MRACIPDTTEIFYVVLFVPCSLTSPLLMGLEGVQCITFSYHTVPMNTHKHCTHTQSLEKVQAPLLCITIWGDKPRTDEKSADPRK